MAMNEMNPLNYQKIQSNAYRVAQFAVLFMALSSPISRAAFNIGVGLLILGWVFSFDYSKKWQKIKTSYISLAILLFFSIVCLSVIYTSASQELAWKQVSTYSKLLYIPLIISIWRDNNKTDRNWLKYTKLAFIFSLIILIAAVYINIILSMTVGGFSMYKGVFYHRIAQGMMLSYIAVWSLQKIYYQINFQKYILGILFSLLFLLSLASVFYFNHSRAAHLGLFFGVLVCTIMLFRGKYLFIILPIIILSSVIIIKSPVISSRFTTAWNEAQNFQLKAQENTSVGARLKAWEGSVEQWIKAPILGNGAGSYKQWAYSNIHANTCKMGVCDQPHNQYLVVASELGVLGLVGLLAIIVAPLIKQSYRLQSTHILLYSFSAIFWVMALTDSTILIRPYLFFYIMSISLLLLEYKLAEPNSNLQ